MIAAGTDYAIFFVGRYHEARAAGEEREDAFYAMYRGTSHVVLGSGLTVASAVACLSFTRLPYFHSLGLPAAIGILVALAASLTLGPAILTIASHFGLFDPKRVLQTRSWRRIGTAIVRWPGPILVVSIAIALIGLLALPGYKTSYDTRPYIPGYAAANVGYTAAERHFPRSRLEPELLMIEADHDLRNPADMLVLDKVAKGIVHIPGIAQVQSITRPLGAPLDHSSIAFQISQQSIGQVQNLKYQMDRAQDLLRQSAELTKTIGILHQQYALQQQLAGATHDETQKFHETLAIISEVRDKLANFDDFFRPLHSYFYWEKHCYDIPVCFALRNTFEALDSIDQLTEKFEDLVTSLDKLDSIQPQLVGLIPPQIASQEINQELVLKNFATNSGIANQSATANDNPAALGQAFDKSKNDDLFYLPPEVFSNPDFKRGLKLFLSPDGKAARMIITHEGDPAEPAAISHVDPIKLAAHEAVKNTPLAGSSFYLGGTASTFKDIGDMESYDLLIVTIASLSLILLIMMLITRSLVAAIVIVGTVALSLGASFGLSVLVWQYLLGHQIVLGRTGFGGHPAAGRRIRLQPAAHLPIQRGDPRRTQDRHHPRNGRLRVGGDRSRSGLRRHHVRVRVQRPAGTRPDRHHHRPGSAVRHFDRAFLHDADHRHPARPLVLVAAAGATASGQSDAAALRIAARRSSAAAVGRRRRHGDVGLISTDDRVRDTV